MSADVSKLADLLSISKNAAQQYLKLCNDSLDEAIELYYSDPTLHSEPSLMPPPRVVVPTHPHHQPAVAHPHHRNTERPVGRRQKRVSSDGYGRVEEIRDEDIGASGFQIPPDPTETVRAPIPHKMDVLNDVPPLLQRQPQSAITEMARYKHLCQTRLLALGSFKHATQQAAHENKYLVVYLGDFEDFETQTVVRDLWDNRDLLALIKRHFLVWQPLFRRSRGEAGPDVQKFISSYRVQSLPFMGILDWRTKELRLKLEIQTNHTKRFNVEYYRDQFQEFIQHENLSGMKPHPVLDLTEDEQLNLALQMSTQSAPKRRKIVYSDDEEEEVEDEKVTEIVDDDVVVTSQPSTTTAARTAASTESPVALTEVKTVPPEPAAETPAAKVTTICFRLRDGSRIVRKFLKASPVQILFDFLEASVPSLANQPFEISLHAKTLRNRKLETLEEADVLSAMLTVSMD